MAREYRVLVGLNYPPHGKGRERRAEPGDVVDDLPKSAIAHLLEAGSIEEAEGGEP